MVLADALFQPADEDDLAAFLRAVPEEVPLTIVGVGSNLLVRDGGIQGFVVRLSAKGFGAMLKCHLTDTGSAQGRPRFPTSGSRPWRYEAGIGGFHFYHGIPGARSAVRCSMNAGANGVETRERVVEVNGLLTARAMLHVLSNADMGYAYRHSSAPAGLIFTSALFEGYAEDQGQRSRQRWTPCRHHRETVQPIREKTGGSTFKNPEGTSAWKEIDKAGCRGLMVGGAQMSPMHCNFMINTGNATGYDLEYLGETVRARVLENSGIRLHWEIKRLGNFKPGREVQEFLGQLL